MSYREAYLWGEPYNKLDENQKEIRDKLIKAFRNYKIDLADVKNKKLLLASQDLPEHDESLIVQSIRKIELRLMYLDNLIGPLVKKDKELIYYKYVEGLTHFQIMQRSTYYKSSRSVQSRALRVIGILTLRTDPLILKDDI
ncbi:hypothetical protein SDC9_167535 [bioreactor metagenome]|uniref:Uncharacterized protein n=1 Tax=bioreactor metagenome TaxID=1076179 RepID=A0A645G009_9ZZZZ